MHALQAVGIPSGPVLTGRDVHYDSHFKSRNFLERAQYPPERKMGERTFLSRPYKFSKSPLHIQGPSPAFGQHNQPSPPGAAGCLRGDVPATGGGRGDHHGADHRRAVAGHAAAGGAGTGDHIGVGPGLPRAAGAGGVGRAGGGCASVRGLDSRLRGNDGWRVPGLPRAAGTGGVGGRRLRFSAGAGYPACAGMTVGGSPDCRERLGLAE